MQTNATQQAQFDHDLELTGQIGKALNHGHDFAYYLAAFANDASERPRFLDTAQTQHGVNDEGSVSFYRHSPLSAQSDDFEKMQVSAQFLHQQQLTSLRLWQSMHPEPLAHYNNPQRIDDEVLDNCEWHVRQRNKQSAHQWVKSQPTELEQLIPAERAMLA
ncbi:VC2046/SO_2500 family protein [Alteromonas oceanisediminis]|uniref:VC2046/SO_2500 family protein n=1 Tax=Alteromonas oceanisediminis TaxID=2836180 RepID=UPI001BD94269|nr:VC2046/SO_2500 family protein [Alteromonas oceanisediminis]MBT0587184.1 hypothetical protein [Alteromonas oceanisediminis]